MDPPVTDLGPNKKIDEELKGEDPLFHCDLVDSEVIHKIAQAILPGLATACVDNTTGDPFRSPGSVAVDMRKEMVDYLTLRSETHIAETVIEKNDLDVETSDHPTDIISDFIDDFAISKRNLFSRVSGWLLSERREDKIDDFVQEMEINRFWLMDRREAIGKNLLKNVDFKNLFHCKMKFNTAEELAEHSSECIFRSTRCTNDGCSSNFCALHLGKHDAVCPYKVLPCEQKCSESIVRREMDRHCITVCPMKLVNCPFHLVGCQYSIPCCLIDKHCSEFLHSHLLYVLETNHREAHWEDLSHRVELLEKSSSLDLLLEARDVKSLTVAVKELEAKIGPSESEISNKDTETAMTVAQVSNKT
ncbi:TNF receptor-associated factor family protein DDB_G0290965-like isoform X2 [Macadamia integrifolia]|uniref:TNF receptor-associated factor family protein DDB_G0290965-like isoform X2 n=1 Tax=Macadamia integrifolia TaxID=60698 RepID=UPI001C4EDC6B|nr:TNF receptor-associated factor family protein DDB_G0290965-like isoform X2 [Macadamia integrifolia]